MRGHVTCTSALGDKKFAVGAFNDNQETLIAVSKAAANLQSPVLVEVSDGGDKGNRTQNIRDMVDNYKAEWQHRNVYQSDPQPTVDDCKARICGL